MVVAPALVPSRGAGGVSSWVEYQRASGRTPLILVRRGGGCRPGSSQYLLQRVPFRVCVVVVEDEGPGGWVWSVVHYWVLRQQAPSWSVLRVPPLCPFGWVGVVVRAVVVGCWLWVPGVLPVVVVPVAGPGPPVCGVCGLLFENCIVDASILRTGAAAGPGVSSSEGWPGVVVVSCS